MLFLTNSGSNTSQNSSRTTTYPPSLKPSKYDLQDILRIASEVRTKCVLFSTLTDTGCRQEDLPGAIDEGADGERGSEKFVLSAPFTDDEVVSSFIFVWYLQVKLVTVVEGDPRDPFSITTTPRCREGRNSFAWIAPLYP